MIPFALWERLKRRSTAFDAMAGPLRIEGGAQALQAAPISASPVTGSTAPSSASGSGPSQPPRRRPLWLVLLSILGPGIIAAAAGNDAGGIATYSQMGAQYGISLLWTIVVVTVGLIVVQEMCARMGVVTGKGLAALIRENFGVKVTFFAMICLVVANLALTVSEFAGIAAVGEMFLGPHARFVVVPIAMAIVWQLVARGTYRIVERIFLVASLIFGTYIITAIKIGVPWSAVLSHSLLPDFAHTKWNTDLVVAIVTLIGTTISPYMQFYQQSAVRDKGTKIKDYNLVKWDVVIGCVLSDVVAAFIIIACAETLFKAHIFDINSASQAAEALRPLAGANARLLFAFGLLNASLMAAVVVPLSTAYAVTEALGWESGFGRRVRELPLFYGTYGALILVGGLIIFLLPSKSNLIQTILNAQIINCALLPIELILMLVLINRRRIMGSYRNGIAMNTVAIITTITAAALSLFLLFRQIIQWIHPS
jgi:NRAMP (natural resistance-associated macrophage protein)-like metal ion transporter